MAQTATRRRVKIGATVDPDLARAVDTYVRQHPGTDRSKVIDEALWLWVAKEQERELREQYEAPDDVPPEEAAAWRAIRDAAFEAQFRRWNEEDPPEK